MTYVTGRWDVDISTECKGSEGQEAEQDGIGNTMIGTGYG